MGSLVRLACFTQKWHISVGNLSLMFLLDTHQCLQGAPPPVYRVALGELGIIWLWWIPWLNGTMGQLWLPFVSVPCLQNSDCESVF